METLPTLSRKQYEQSVTKAIAYLKLKGQSDDGSYSSYGGIGPTALVTVALLRQRALIFVSRCQNLESEHNTTFFSAKNPDGGFYYTPVAGGSSPAGETANGGLRSYGAMTYAGLKSMLHAGVGPDDPRVKAAVEWARKHYDLKSNPGLGTAGLYYYYHLFAKDRASNKCRG